MGKDFLPASDAMSDLCRRFHVRRLDVFGSAATGRGFDPDTSDLDLLVTFDEMPSTDYANAYFGLREALEALSGRPIDLVTEAALVNPYLRTRIEAERLTLFPVSGLPLASILDAASRDAENSGLTQQDVDNELASWKAERMALPG